jgi:hypothetical protein
MHAFVRVQKEKHHYLYLDFIKEPKFWNKNKKLKVQKIRDRESNTNK